MFGFQILKEKITAFYKVAKNLHLTIVNLQGIGLTCDTHLLGFSVQTPTPAPLCMDVKILS